MKQSDPQLTWKVSHVFLFCFSQAVMTGSVVTVSEVMLDSDRHCSG